MPRIHQEADFPASPSWVYAALVDPRRLAALTGEPAAGEPSDGAEFSAYDGYVVGRHIELVPNLRVVQAWREKAWPEGVYSLVRFELRCERTDGSIYGVRTTVVLDQIGFPPQHEAHLTRAWAAHWDKIQNAFC